MPFKVKPKCPSELAAVVREIKQNMTLANGFTFVIAVTLSCSSVITSSLCKAGETTVNINIKR